MIVQAPAPPVGSVEVRTSPSKPTATHWELEAQETAKSDFALGMRVAFQAPPAGSVVVKTPPLWSTATQSDSEGQETPRRLPLRRSLRETWEIVQAPAPPVGSVEVTTVPCRPTPTQNELDGQDIPKMVSSPLRPRSVTAQVEEPRARAGRKAIEARQDSAPRATARVPSFLLRFTAHLSPASLDAHAQTTAGRGKLRAPAACPPDLTASLAPLTAGIGRAYRDRGGRRTACVRSRPPASAPGSAQAGLSRSGRHDTRKARVPARGPRRTNPTGARERGFI